MTLYNRANPFFSRIKERTLLTKEGSTKKVYHLSLDLAQSGIIYRPGDTIAILPSNDPQEVESFLAYSEDSPELRDFLTTKANLQKISKALMRALELEETKVHTPRALLAMHPHRRFSAEEFMKLFMPLLPRFYSIASSQLLHPEEVHLTVAETSYFLDGIWHQGVGSHFLCERASVVPLYLQPSRHFALPQGGDLPIILVGPGTGVAPYRSFLQERIATGAKGRNWLFFGARNFATDFYYGEYWTLLQTQGVLRLSCAFSRDFAQKVYVQHKMWEHRRDLWAWLEEGAYFYVCGDAHVMAKDVGAMLEKIAAEEGGLSPEEAHRKIKELRTQKRYLTDVY